MAYFDIFSYPVNLEDIQFFLDQEAPAPVLEKQLSLLMQEGRIFQLGDFYSLRDNPLLVEQRLAGRRHADFLLDIAVRNSRFLYQFPFVRGICISGSLSKRCAGPNADIDYFIITQPGRLWIARTIMHFYKKLTFLRGRQHRYCMNYYIDEEALEIKEKNIFTATELITLMPASGGASITRLFRANAWASRFLPNYRRRPVKASHHPKDSLLKQFIEFLFNNPMGKWLDNYLHQLTQRRWKQKEEEQRLDMKGIVLSLQCSKHFARPNPAAFQQKVLSHFQNKLDQALHTTSSAVKEYSNRQ